MIDPSATVQTHFSLEIRIPFQTHTMLEKTVNGKPCRNEVACGNLDFVVFRPRSSPRDYAALTPLIWEHINPSGRFELDMSTRLTLP